MDAPLALAQVAQAIEKLAVVGRQDHDFGVIAAEDRLLEAAAAADRSPRH